MNQIPEMPRLLHGRRILICRPEPGASELCHVLETVGADCLKMPMLSTEALPLSEEAKQAIINLDTYHHVIVVSQHAAELALQHIDEYWPQLPLSQTWYPIGRKTLSVLQSEGVTCYQTKEDLSSEKLISLSPLKNLEHDRVLLLKGKGGRDLIQQALTQRAAVFDSIELYERHAIDYTDEVIKQSLNIFSPEIIVALSGETLTNLLHVAEQASIDLSEKSFILSSNRVANMAYDAGIKNVYIPDNLMPIDIIKCITSKLKN